MAQFASARNTLLVAPPGCGKTKVMSMVLDDLWREKPSAKVSYSSFITRVILSDVLSTV